MHGWEPSEGVGGEGMGWEGDGGGFCVVRCVGEFGEL